MTDTQRIGEFIEYMTNTKNASKNTLSAYERDLEAFSSYAKTISKELCGIVSSDISSYKKKLADNGFSTSSVSRIMSSIRGFYKYLLIVGAVEENPSASIKNDKAEKKDFEILSDAEVELLLSQPDTKTIKGIRDKAMLELMYATGMKVGELISLSVSDVNIALGYVAFHGDSSAKHARTVFLYPAALAAVKEYLEKSRKFLYVSDNALFLNVNGSAMTRQGFWKILKNYASDAGISKTITPLTLRHSFATHLLENGADINDIKEILGHSDIASTQVYANYIKSRIKNSYLKFHPRA